MKEVRALDETGPENAAPATARSWSPLLTGSLARRAWEAVQDIAADLRAAPPAEVSAASLAAGDAGQALFWSYLAQAGGGEECEERALACVEGAVEALSTQPLGAMLYVGYPGVGWMVEHLQGRLLTTDEGEDPGEELDDALLQHLDGPAAAAAPVDTEYDVIAGLAGLGVYALERLPRPRAAECLERVVDRLAATAEARPEGVAWRTPSGRLWGDLVELAPDGAFNVGVAHGLPGVVGVLAGACAAGIAVERARPLLDAAVAWLLAQKLEDRSLSTFPDFAGPGVPPRPARLAWCYGDTGIAATLYAAGRVVGEAAWQREALDIAVAAATRPSKAARIHDDCLCHGAAGLGHLFNRLYQASGDPRLGDIARYWFGHSLDHRRPGEGMGGYLYQAYQKEDQTFRAIPAGGFLEGSAGIGLALLGALSPVEPEWDRLLVASLR
ncbi:MAG TPA: lanthionine synthetase C family protein [Thermoanaerobaculia bacterium]|nr:lanthionine synthetase C family protein [Thermoanaerobaculia bacterium]